MAAQINEEFEFRAVLIKIQDVLSNEDRVRLHFLFGDDIPRRLQSNGSLETALEGLQALFDRVKISRNNYDYLVRALETIERHDCAKRLLDYQKLVPLEIIPLQLFEQQQGQNQEAGNIALPPTTSQRPSASEFFADLEETDAIVQPPIDRESFRFNPPEPAPMDFSSIDLTPFEDASCPWTEEYSKLLSLAYHPRHYQIEIIRDAIRNRKTIICLRTGSGKTFIASVLIKYYFIKTHKDDPNAQFKTLFFVPRKAIRLQQAKAIDAVGNLKVQICDDDQTIDQLIATNHVIVATPQKFVNCLKKGTIRLSQINLMVFDECHNTSGGNPYCEIMKFYSCPSKQETASELKPLIIGLTATISAKDAGEKRESVDKNLISLCSKLSCQTISTVCDKNNIEEINHDISRPQNDQFEFVLKVEYNTYFNDYLEIFENVIKQIKQHLDNHQLLDGHIIGSSSFIGQLVLLKQTCETKGEMNNIIICDYLLLLTKKYSALKDLPFDMVIKYIIEKIEAYHQRYEKPTPMDNLLHQHSKTELNKLLEKHAEHAATNPKLDNLVKLLKRHATENAKGLVLVQKTFYTKTLCDYLSDRSELKDIVKPTWMVGQNSSDYSQSINEQQEGLKKFREDECNVLIATDIVQEGLDIPTCSYVIRYEFVSDEIGTIQSRGRARAKNSSYYLITELESVNHKREKNNKSREDEMELAISQWPGIDKDMFRRDVENKTKLHITNWEKELKIEKDQKDALQKIGKKDGSICCRKCGEELGELAWLKRRNMIYFINNAEFFKKNECELKSLYKNFQENLIMGEVKCHCGNSLGGCQKFMDRPELGLLCALKCIQIKFMIDKKKPYIEFPQWTKNNRFDVEELEEI